MSKNIQEAASLLIRAAELLTMEGAKIPSERKPPGDSYGKRRADTLAAAKRLGPTFTSAQLARAMSGVSERKVAGRLRIYKDLFEKVTFYEWRVRGA